MMRENMQYCTCVSQEHITDEDVQKLITTPALQLRNLAQTFEADVRDRSIYDIRDFFTQSHVPFRNIPCHIHSLGCCCNCTLSCNRRCIQDVLNRAYLLCGHLLEAYWRGRDITELLQSSSMTARCLFEELVADTPRPFAIRAMVKEHMSKVANPNIAKDQPNPNVLTYAPVMEYEQARNKKGQLFYRKVVDPQTGEAKVLNWPQSGLCPFCLPSNTIVRTRIAGKGDRRSKDWKKKYYGTT